MMDSLRYENLLLQKLYRSLRNRARMEPVTTGVRSFAALVFLALILWFVLWLGTGIDTVISNLSNSSPILANKLFREIVYRLFLPLFPLMIISHAVTALAVMLRDHRLPFYMIHPISRGAFLRLTGWPVFFVTSGYLYLFSTPLFFKLGGFCCALECTAYLTLFLSIAFSAGVILTLFLATMFPPGFLSRIFGLALAVSGIVFIVSFRDIRPELFWGSSTELLAWLGSESFDSRTPVGLLSELISSALFGEPRLGSVFLLIIISIVSLSTAILISYLLIEKSWQRARVTSTHKAFLKPRIPVSRPWFALMIKEWMSLIRNPTRFSQLALMAALIFLYLYNLKYINLNPLPDMEKIMMTLHTGMIGFILGALGVRFAFPAPSLDGPAVWFTGSHPVSRFQTESGRAICYMTMFGMLSVVLTIGFGRVLSFPLKTLATLVGVNLILSFVLAATAVLMGNFKPQYENDNPLQIGFSPEGLSYFAVALVVSGISSWLIWILT